jgi:FkbM family methyltransferase
MHDRPTAKHRRRVIGGVEIEFDLRNSHERAYFGRSPERPLPQADIDVLIFQRFVYPGDVVLDAGGNIGVTAAEMIAAGASRVHVFELNPPLATRLQALRSDKLVIHPVGLSDHDGEVTFYESQTHNQGSTINPRMLEVFPAVYTGCQPNHLPVRRLDTVCPDVRFDFMKIDIEGAEAAFLRGAREVLSRHLPRAVSAELYGAFFAEVHLEASGHYRHCLRALIARKDYSLHLLDASAAFDAALYHETSPTFVFTNDASAAQDAGLDEGRRGA